jgi:cytochrome c biogenesis protein CcmG/thiol:disulfide interchange protein DsbE
MKPSSKTGMALIPLGLFAVVVALCALPLLEGRDPSIIPSALIGKPVPAFALPQAVEGLPGLSRADFKNLKAPVLVNVFASWCVTCRAEQKTLEALAARTGVTLYGIDYKDARPDAAAWLAEYGNPFKAIGFDAAGRTAIDWGVYGVPETFVVDRLGIIRYKHVGAIMPEDVTRVFLPLLAELRQ